MSKISKILIDIKSGNHQLIRQHNIKILLSIKSRFHILRYISFAFIILIACVAHSLVSLAAQNTWETTTDKEAGFTIKFPGQPAYEQTVNPQTGNQSETYKFHFGESFLSITFSPYLKSHRNIADVSRAWAEITHEMSKSGTLLQQNKLPDGARQYDNLEVTSNGTLQMRTRVYLRNGRHYQLVYGTFALAGINEQVAEQFFSSFNLNNTSASKSLLTRNRMPRQGRQARIKPFKWYRLRSPSGNFVVEFPGKPEYRLLQNRVNGKPDHKFYFFFGENLFTVTYRDDPQANINPDRALQHALQSYLTADRERWQVTNKAQLPNGGYDIESQGLLNGVPVYMRTQLYIHRTRLYNVTVMTDKLIGPNNTDVHKFFSSFHLL